MLKKSFSLLFILFTIASVQAQSIEEGSNIVGFGVRLGIYNTTLTNQNPPSGTNPNSYGQTGDIIYHLSYDRGMNDHFTVGGQFRYNSFIVAKDTSATEINVAYSIELDIDAAYHFVRSEHTDLYIQALAGGSYIRIANTNINNQVVFTAEGISYGLELGARFYIGDHFGIQLNFAYSGCYYPDGTIASLGGSSEKDSFLLTGSTYGLGLCYKF